VRRFRLRRGTKVSLFAAMSAAETNAPEVTATLFSFRTPLVASVE
jgi:hypothetical protein